MKKPQAECKKKLLELSNAYYNGTSQITDQEFDSMVHIYEQRFHTSWDNIGALPCSSSAKIKLPFPLGSLDKIKTTDQKKLDKWKSLHPGSYLLDEKLDGVSALYLPKTQQLYTRGDGHIGSNISSLLPHLQLPFSFQETIAIRGEIIIQRAIFNSKFSPQFKNSRNFVSGIINSHDPDPKRVQSLDFVAYEILYPRNQLPLDQLLFLKNHGFKIPNYSFLSTLPSTESLENLYLEMKATSLYDMDGLVITHQNIHAIPSHGNPSFAFAFKPFLEEVKLATVEKVIWTVSKHGQIKPKIQIQPVELGGVTIQYATAFNGRYIEENKIGPGASILITRSGDVIPFIVKVIQGAHAQMPDIPWEWNASRVDVIVRNKGENEQVKIFQAVHFFSTLKVRGMAKKTIEKIVQKGWESIEEIISLQEKDLVEVFGPKQSTNLYQQLQEFLHSEVDESLLMSATPFFGFGLGVKKIKTVVQAFPDFKTKKDLMLSLSQLSGWSESTAQQFIQGLPFYLEFIKKTGLRILNQQEKHDKKEAIIFVFSGFRNKSLENWIQHSYGGKVEDTVTKNTCFLITKDFASTTSKMKKANQLEIPILSEEQFMAKFKPSFEPA